MNDNLPLGAQYDPDAPWNQEDLNVEQEVSDVRMMLADELPMLVWELAKELVDDEDKLMAIYDEVMDDAKKIWER